MSRSSAPRRRLALATSVAAEDLAQRPIEADGVDAPARAGAVLSKALVRAAARLGLGSQKELAEVLGTSPPTVSRLLKGARPLDPVSNEGQRAVLFLRIWRSLDTLVGGDQRAASDWFHAPNQHLGGVPSNLTRSITGLVHVVDYLDAMRGKV